MSEPLSNKMNQWECSPPPGAWQAISLELQEWNAEKKLAQRLQAIETVPPAESWTAIAAALNQQAQPAAILVEKRVESPAPRRETRVRTLFPYLIRYGAAAAVIGFIAWALINSNSGGRNLNSTAIPLSSQASAHSEAGLVPRVEQPAQNTIAQTSRSEGNRSELGRSQSATRKRKDPSYAFVRHSRSQSQRVSTNWEQLFSTKLRTEPIRSLPVQQRDQRYIQIAAQNGNTIRLSAKFAPIYHYLTNRTEETVPQFQTISRLEQQLQQADFVPNPANLFDLLMLKELIEEN
jgi:hypothetical protein